MAQAPRRFAEGDFGGDERGGRERESFGCVGSTSIGGADDAVAGADAGVQIVHDLAHGFGGVGADLRSWPSRIFATSTMP